MMTSAETLAALSTWIDSGNAHRAPEAILWGRVAKVGEEAGEVVAALIGLTGQNPRKGVTHTEDELIGELLDVVVTGLAAVEHVTGNLGKSLELLDAKLGFLAERAGLS